jgi:hypothetical protein
MARGSYGHVIEGSYLDVSSSVQRICFEIQIILVFVDKEIIFNFFFSIIITFFRENLEMDNEIYAEVKEVVEAIL